MLARDRRGYTLIELVVVILIIGILASFAVPQYLRTVEGSKADDAVATINMIGTTNKMFALDHAGAYVSGKFTAACGTQTGYCDQVGTGLLHPPPYTDPCVLVYCNYLADQDWANKPYDFYACDGATNGSCAGQGSGYMVSGGKRKSTAYTPYNTWAYTMNTSGVIQEYGTNAPKPTY
jgi:prepilin-type N-terminal cleavage/methylation domain-containing protein